MDEMEVDDMDLDGEVDQESRRRAAEKLSKRMKGAAMRDKHAESTMTEEQARDVMRKLTPMLTGNKITTENAFDLNGIDALKILVFQPAARASALCGEGHFQNACMGLDIGMRIYCMRVDAVYREAFKCYSDGNGRKDAERDHGAESEHAGEGNEGADGEEGTEAGGVEGDTGFRKNKKRNTADMSSTLLDDEALKQSVKERTFDMDPFFVRTSRLIDENSPQGLLLHNLPVLASGGIAFDPDARLTETPSEVKSPGEIPGLNTDKALLSLSALPSIRQLREAAAAALPISPDIEELYTMLQEPDEELPGLRIAARVDPDELLRTALAENNRERADVHRTAIVRQIVRQVEDAMDVDMADAGDVGDHQTHPSNDDLQLPGELKRDKEDAANYGGEDAAAFGVDDYDGVEGFDGAPSTSDVFQTSESADAWKRGAGQLQRGSDDEAHMGAGSDRTEGDGSDEPDDRDGRNASDDESAMLSLLSGFATGSVGGPVASHSSWWKSRIRKKQPAGAAKQRARRLKPEEVPLDWRAEVPAPQLEDAALHTYKTVKREATAKLCLPREEPARPEDLRSFFSVTASTSGFDPRVSAGTGCGMFDLEDAWKAALIADRARERQMRREVRAAVAGGRCNVQGAAAAALGTPLVRKAAEGGPAMSGTSGLYDGDIDGGNFDGYESGGGNNGPAAYGNAGYDDAGASDVDDDDEEEQPQYADARGPTLEELLQPPRRFQRTTIKFDRTAGVADVASLKANMEQSLKHLTVNNKGGDLQQPSTSSSDQPSVLSFQSVLDEVSQQVAERTDSQQGPKEKPSGGRGASAVHGQCPEPLAGVSTHLAFICLLHLANEKGLALSNGGDLNLLLISGLNNLMREGHVGR